MRLCSIASGSSGNCIYVGSDTTHLLVDTGISGKKVEFGLNSLDLTTGTWMGFWSHMNIRIISRDSVWWQENAGYRSMRQRERSVPWKIPEASGKCRKVFSMK